MLLRGELFSTYAQRIRKNSTRISSTMPEEDTDRPTSITVYPNPPDNFNDDCVNGKLKTKLSFHHFVL